VIRHRIATTDSAKEALWWGSISLTWFGPHQSEYAINRDIHGFIPAFSTEPLTQVIRLSTETENRSNRLSTETKDRPKPTEFTELLEYVNSFRLNEISRASAYRAFKDLVAEGSWLFEQGAIIPVKDPALPDRKRVTESGMVSLGKTYFIGGTTFSTMGMPEDVRTEIEPLLELEHQSFCTWLKEGRYERRQRAVRLMDYAHTLIKRREEEKNSAPSSSSTVEEATTTAHQPPPPEPVPEPEPEPEPLTVSEPKTISVEEPEHQPELEFQWLATNLNKQTGDVRLDNRAVEDLRRSIRNAQPSATKHQIVSALRYKVRKWYEAGKKGPFGTGLVLTSVAELAKSKTLWQEVCDDAKNWVSQIQSEITKWQEHLRTPDLLDAERAEVRELLAETAALL